MGLEQWISASAAALFLALAILALNRGSDRALAPPLAWLCIAFFAYDTVELVRHFTEAPIWDWLDGAAAPLAAPPTLWFAVVFVGRARELRGFLRAAATYFCGLGALCSCAMFVPALREFPGSESWATAMLVGLVPTFGAIPFLLASHARRADPEERARTLLLGLTLLLGTGGVMSDLFAIAGAAAPRIAAVGIVMSVVLLGFLTFEARIVSGISGLVIFNALAVAALAVLGHLVVIQWLGDETSLTIFGAVAVTMALLAAIRPLVTLITEERVRSRHLATLGRFSAQMAHDLRNPLSAIVGSVQFLREERKQGRSIDLQMEFVEVIGEQADRLLRVIESYQRLGRVEPVLAPTDLRALVEAVVRAQAAAARAEGIEVRADVPALPVIADVDPDLLESALENLIRNAREAMRGASGRGIQVELEEHPRWVHLRVRDEGPGIDARTRARAFEDFFTTKASGSGLGLAYVRRVAEAHGGHSTIESEVAKGTVVELTLPRREGSVRETLRSAGV